MSHCLYDFESQAGSCCCKFLAVMNGSDEGGEVFLSFSQHKSWPKRLYWSVPRSWWRSKVILLPNQSKIGSILVLYVQPYTITVIPSLTGPNVLHLLSSRAGTGAAIVAIGVVGNSAPIVVPSRRVVTTTRMTLGARRPAYDAACKPFYNARLAFDHRALWTCSRGTCHGGVAVKFPSSRFTR